VDCIQQPYNQLLTLKDCQDSFVGLAVDYTVVEILGLKFYCAKDQCKVFKLLVICQKPE